MGVGGKHGHAAHALGVQAIQCGADRELTVSHGDLHPHAGKALAEEARLLTGVMHEGRALLQPDAAVLAGHLAGAHPQDDSFEDRLPQERVHLDDAPVGEELAEEGADRSGLGGTRGSKVDQDEGDGVVGVGGRGGGEGGLGDLGVLGVHHASSVVIALPRVADGVSPPPAGGARVSAWTSVRGRGTPALPVCPAGADPSTGPGSPAF